MSGLPGGSADKLGNRYEAWWTIYRIADLLTGHASRMRLEPPGRAGRGIEFWIEEQGVRRCEQVKDAPAKGAWTLTRLRTENVLTSVRGQLEDGHRVRLVLSTPATELQALASRARAAESVEEYRAEVLTAAEDPNFERVRAALGARDDEEAWAWLRRIEVEHHPPESLHLLVRARLQLLIQGDPDGVIHQLRGWLHDTMLNQELTGPQVFEYLDGQGLPRRLLVGDQSTLTQLEDTRRRQERLVTNKVPRERGFGLVLHPHTEELVDRLVRLPVDRGGVVVLHGSAGSGKSTIATEAVRRLVVERGWFSATVAMDAVSETASAAALGAAFGLTDAPQLLLAGVAGSAPAVMLVDQLDAVSLYGGRRAASYEAVLEMLDQARALRLKVVLVVRTVDLETDHRLSVGCSTTRMSPSWSSSPCSPRTCARR